MNTRQNRHASHLQPLHRGEFARLAYDLGRRHATGVLTVFTPSSTKPDVLVLRRGQLMAAHTDALGRRTRQHLARIASMSRARYMFDSGTVAYPPGAVRRQFDLAAWARSHFEAQVDAALARVMVTEFTGVRLYVATEHVPDASICDATDRRILTALETPRRLDQIWHMARTPRFRLLSFLHFLRSVDALQIAHTVSCSPEPRVATGAHHTLGVAPGADRLAVKRAYRRLARTLHPDLHPDASDAKRRHLERKLAAVTNAYTELVS